MGPLFVLVCPCFRENVIVACKIVSFLCSSDNFLLKNVIIFFFGNQISKWRLFEKRTIFDLLFTSFSHQGRHKNSVRTYLTYIHIHVGESWGMANESDGEWRTGQYLVEGIKVIKCFHPRMLTPPMARTNTNSVKSRIIRFLLSGYLQKSIFEKN